MFFLEQDGTAIDLDLSSAEAETRCEAQAPYYGSLAGICRDLGVQASAFRHPVTVDLLFSGREIIKNDWKITGLTPVSKQAVYKLTFFEGVLYPGGKHLSELLPART